MLDLQAALGICQLRKVDRFNARRTALAERYDQLLADVPEVNPIARVPYPATHAWHLYIVRVDLERLTIDRDGFMTALEQEGLDRAPLPALHTGGYYREKCEFSEGALPNAEAAAEEIMSLPLYPLLTEDDQDVVVQAIAKVAADHRRTP